MDSIRRKLILIRMKMKKKSNTFWYLVIFPRIEENDEKPKNDLEAIFSNSFEDSVKCITQGHLI